MSKPINSSSRRSARARILTSAMVAAGAMAATMLPGTPARAASLYWDTNGASGGASSGTTADGTWDASTPNWTSDSTGGSATSAWTSGSTAVFSAGSNATGTSNIAVTGTQSVGGLTVEDGSVVFNGGTVDFGGAGGTVTMGSNGSAVAHNLTVNSAITGSGTVTVTGGVGTLTLNGDASGFSGPVTIGETTASSNSGINIVAGANNALGSGAITFAPSPAGGTAQSVSTRAALLLADGVSLTNPSVTVTGGGSGDVGQISTLPNATATFNGNVVAAGTINNAPNPGLATFGAQENGTLILNGQLTDPNGSWLAKTGRGTAVLTQSSPSFTGGVRVIDGALEVQADGALGAGSAASSFNQVWINAIALPDGEIGSPRLVFAAPANSSGFDYAYGDAPGTGTYRFIYMNSGYNGFTALHQAVIDNTAGNNRFGGDFAISGYSDGTFVHDSFGAETGTSLELSGRLYSTGTFPRYLTKTGGGELIISGDNNGTAGDPGTGVLNALGGLFEIQNGTLTLRSSDPAGGVLKGAGSPYGVFNFKIDPGGTLKLDNSLAVNTARIDSNAAISLNGGEMELVGNANQSVLQSAGNVQASGFSIVTVNQPTSGNGSTTTLDFTTATFLNGGTALFRGIDGSTGFININGTLVGGGGVAGTTNISILPQVVGDPAAVGAGTDFVTIQSGFARALTASEYAPLVSGANSLDNTTALTPGTLSLAADTKVNSLKISAGTNLSIASGHTLSLNSGALLQVGSGDTQITGGTVAFQNSSNGAVPGYVTVSQGNTMTIASNLGNSSGMTKSGYGTLTLAADNSATYAGPTTINSGILAISNDNNLGNASAKVNINGGTLQINSSLTSARTISLESPLVNAIDVPAGQNVTLTGTINNGSASAGELVKTGDGNLILTGNNTYLGPNGDGTSIDAGTLTISSDNNVNGAHFNASNVFDNEVVLNGGSLHLTASGVYGTPLNFNSNTGGLIIDPGVVATFGDPSTPTYGRFTGFGTLILDGGGTLNPISNNLETGDNIIKGGSTLEFTLAEGVSSLSAFRPDHYLLDNGTLLTVGQSTHDSNPASPTDGIATWDANRGITLGAGGGTLAAQVGSSPAPYLLTFPQPIAGVGALTINTDSQSIINLAGPNTYAGATTITAGSTAQVTASGSLGAGLVTNNGTLQAQTTFSMPGGITGTGTTSIGDGTNPATVSAAFYRLPNLTVNAGATARVIPSGGANSSTSRIGTLTMDPTATLDVTDNKVILPGATLGTWNGTAYTGVTGQIAAGRDGGAWDKPGIITSSATPGSNLHTLGVATADQLGKVGQTWGGQTLASGDVLVMYTYGGDANLDGKINIDDYGRIDGNVGQSGSVFGWYNGDFNYDGKINIDDYGIIDGNIGLQGAPIPTIMASGAQVDGVSAVPEPASVGLIGLGAMALLGSRRRRNSKKS